MENRFYFTTSRKHFQAIHTLLDVQDSKIELVYKKIQKDSSVRVGLAYDSIKDLCQFFYYFGAVSLKLFCNE